MASGGKRIGAGRKRGGANLKTRAIADEAARNGITPLEVMLHAMRHAYDAGDFREAAERGRDAAPYCHPKLSSIEVGGKKDSPLTVNVVNYASK